MKRFLQLVPFLLLGMALGLPGGDLMAQRKAKDDGQGGKKGKKAETPAKGAETDPRVKERVDYLFIEASTLYMQEKKTEALGLYQELLVISPKNHAAIYAIGKIQNELKNYNEAVKYCKQALDLSPDNYWYYVELVNAYQGAREADKALAVQEALVKRFPDDKNALFDVAQLYIQNKDYAKAVEVYARLEKVAGANAEIAYRKHQLYLYLNQPDEAMAELDKLIASHPGETRFVQAKYDLLMLQDKQDEAAALLAQLLAMNPNDGFALLGMADIYKSKGQVEKSDEYLQRAFDNPDVELETKVKILGEMYPHAEGNPELLTRMQRMSGSLLRLHPKSALVHGIVGDVLQASEKPDSARTHYRASLALDPSNEQVWWELLVIDSEQNDLASLQKDAEKALDYFPNQVGILYFFGVGSTGMEDYEQGIYAFEKLKKMQVKEKDLMLQTLLSLAECYHHEEQYAKSDENFEAALKLAPGDATALNNYAYYLSLRGERLADASKMVQQALQAHPGNGAFQDTYGWILYLQGDYKGAETWLAKAVAQGGGAEVLEHYGDTWAKLGERDKALEYWKKAIDKGAKFSLDAKAKATDQ